MLIRGMIRHIIHDHFDAVLMGLCYQRIKRIEVTENRIDAGKIGDIVTKVDHRRGIDGRNPDSVDAQPGEMIEFGDDT